MAIRTKYIDDYIVKGAKEGIKQLIVVGCGMDSRAFRYPKSKLLFHTHFM